MTLTRELETAPDETEARAALARVLASEPFCNSQQLGAFLRFVVEETLAGRGAALKGYTIAVEALGRDPSFNPQADPIVRVEATRLRRALERYYADAGRDDAVTIALPRGGYAPSFARGAAPSAVSSPVGLGPSIAGERARPPGALLALAGLLAATVIAALVMPSRDADVAAAPVTAGIAAPAAAGAPPPNNGMPTIYVDALRAVGTPRPGSALAAALTDKIRDAFARFDTVNVAYDPPDADSAARPPAPADYRLVGAVEYGGSATTVRLQLVDAAEGTIAWSRSFNFPAGGPDALAAEDAIVGTLTDTLLQSYGVIRARDRAKQLAAPVGDPRYRCVLTAADSFRTLDPAERNHARTCLEQLTAADPSFAIGFEFLAVVYYREYAMDDAPHSDETPMLDRALKMAQRAIELAPASARAYQMLFVVEYARHDIAAAFAAGDKAMALNKYDMLTVAEYGARLIMTGETERGMTMLRRAGAPGGIRPSWHDFYLFLGNYLLGNAKEAAFHAEQITTDDYPLGLVARAIAAGETGKPDEARRALERLTELQPAWRTDARRLLEKTIYRPEIVDRLLHGLAAAGLPGAT